MDQRISLITLGVDDLARARDFYERGLGWTTTGDQDGVSFYQLPGIAFALFGRADLAEDTRHPIDGRFSGITIAVNQRSEADVDAVLAQAEAAGGTVLEDCRAHRMGWLLRVFRRPGRPRLGDRGQPGLDHQRRRHTDHLRSAYNMQLTQPSTSVPSSAIWRSRM